MRILRFGLYFLFTGALLLLGPSHALSQKGKGGGKDGKGKGGDPGSFKGGMFPGGGMPDFGGMVPGGGMNFDPAQMAGRMFDQFSKGNDYLIIADLPGTMQQRAQDAALAKGITNGRLTR